MYENDIRVPFCIRGPGIPASVQSLALVANIDIAPTILDIVGVADSIMEDMDGRSFWRYVQGQTDPPFLHRGDLLITYHGEGQNPCGMSECPYPWDDVLWMPDSFNNTYYCVRTIVDREDSIFCRFEDDEDFVEFYNLQENPFQLGNDNSKLNHVQRQRYQQRIKELLQCQGSSCS